MASNHPITPPPELVEQWECEYHHSTSGPDFALFISEKAARWGADQELEACCEYLSHKVTTFSADAHLEAQRRSDELRAARRPKLPSLKEQALAKLAAMERLWESAGNEPSDVVRRVLEQLND